MSYTYEEQEFFATCLPGLESLLADELRSFGIKRVRPLHGGVSFFAKTIKAYYACMWSRLASRIVLVLGRVNAFDADELYVGSYKLPWEDIIDPESGMTVRARGTNENLRNTRFTSLKVKDAIADRLREKVVPAVDVDQKCQRASIEVNLRDNRATISFDFSGEALNHRTYFSKNGREDSALASTMAAGLLAAAGWKKLAAEGAAFVDPVSSDGVLLTEAVSIACDAAPGLLREQWGFFAWNHFDERAWEEICAEADSRFETGLSAVAGPEALDAKATTKPDLTRVRFVGISTSSPSIAKARDHIKSAGLRTAASVELGDADNAEEVIARVVRAGNKYAKGERIVCLVASNLESIEQRHADECSSENTFIRACSACPEGSVFALLGGSHIGARFGDYPKASYRLGAGRTEAYAKIFDSAPEGMIQIEVPDSAGGAPHQVEVFNPSSEQFAARLRKVYKERRKWANRSGVTAYRVYDADLPDYAVAIDIYEGSGQAFGNTYVHVAEYAPPASVDYEKARHRYADVLAIVPHVFGVRPDHVFSKTRVREKGGSQYRNAGRDSYVTEIEENGYRFEVDLGGRLDTGIFLDHRDTRKLLEEKAEGTRFLNLFAYTGSATVYAAGGGARETTTVDMSQTYLNWAERNMYANGFTGDAHSFEKDDVMRWITQARRSGRRFDLIFVDPPTFSNSKTMGKRTWDVQRDHVELLIGVSRLLSEEGIAIFSCNLRSFKPYVDELSKYGVEVEDISASTIPQDFARTPKIHSCYIVRHIES